MQLSSLIVVLLALVVGSEGEVDPGIPAEYHGVWKVSAVSDDGVNRPLVENPDVGLSAGECDMMEIIICESRAVIVEADGDAMVGRARVLASNPELKIEWTGFGYHAKQDGPSYVLVKRLEKNFFNLRFAKQTPKLLIAPLAGGNGY